MILSLIVPTLPQRADLAMKLFHHLSLQSDGLPVEIISDHNTTEDIGTKRNRMLAMATGKYIAFIDDDDRVSDNYVQLLLEGCALDVDCCSLNGIITTDGKNPKVFKHSIEYTEMFERDNIYYRMPNHLNAVKREHAIKCPFPPWKFSEDSNYAFQLMHAGLLKTEHKIEQTIYYYDYISDKKTFYK